MSRRVQRDLSQATNPGSDQGGSRAGVVRAGSLEEVGVKGKDGRGKGWMSQSCRGAQRWKR